MVKYTPSHGIPYPEDGDAITNFPSVAEQAATTTDSALYPATVDTGIRAIEHLIPEITSGIANLSRVGPVVTLTLDAIQLGSLTGTISPTTGEAVPRGFRPSVNYVYFNSVVRSTSDAQRAIRFNMYGGCDIYAMSAGDRVTFTMIWSTNEAPPTTLPGNPR